jgi:hypothetical protein
LVVPRNGLVEDIVLWGRTFSRVKYMIFDRAMIALVHYFLLEGITIGEARLLVLS